MTASKKIIQFLEDQGVQFELLEHPAAYTAQEVAGKQHVPGKEMVKSVIVKIDGKVIMCVLPAIHLVDFDSLKKLVGGEDIRLATEQEIANIFPDYEVGAEPPFGHLYDLDVYVDQFLKEDEYILFNAGTHTDLVKMKFADYLTLANPKLAEFGVHI